MQLLLYVILYLVQLCGAIVLALVANLFGFYAFGVKGN